MRAGDILLEAQIDVCIRIGDKINLSFSNKEGGFSLRLVLEARYGSQKISGTWIWDGNEPREDTVDGRIARLSRERVTFEGSWYDKGDSSPWDFFFDSALPAGAAGRSAR